MAYQVLARKWRPQRFDDVVGQAKALAIAVSHARAGRRWSKLKDWLQAGVAGV